MERIYIILFVILIIISFWGNRKEFKFYRKLCGGKWYWHFDPRDMTEEWSRWPYGWNSKKSTINENYPDLSS